MAYANDRTWVQIFLDFIFSRIAHQRQGIISYHARSVSITDGNLSTNYSHHASWLLVDLLWLAPPSVAERTLQMLFHVSSVVPFLAAVFPGVKRYPNPTTSTFELDKGHKYPRIYVRIGFYCMCRSINTYHLMSRCADGSLPFQSIPELIRRAIGFTCAHYQGLDSLYDMRLLLHHITRKYERHKASISNTHMFYIYSYQDKTMGIVLQYHA